MTTELEPVAGNWYTHLDKGQSFFVVSVDEDAGVVEIQHFDGDVEEIELDAWSEMDLEETEEPEDWTGPVDDVEVDDLDYTETDMSARDWRRPLQETRRAARESWEESDSDDEADDWDDDDTADDSYSDDE